MSPEEMLRQSDLELSLFLLREWEELFQLRDDIASQSENWAKAIRVPGAAYSLARWDYRNFKEQVVDRVHAYIKKSKDLAKKLKKLICEKYDYCSKAKLPLTVVLGGIAAVLHEIAPSHVAHALAVFLISRDMLKGLCGCH
ncbi:hypothetical protein I5U45_00985 [Stenotrophomonas maltophilia]|nr:hypothetical protein [Stenotrophomonas maltophilia]